MNDRPNLYDILQVDEHAGHDEIEAAYRRLVEPLRGAPDGDPVRERRLRLLDEALLTLSDPMLRSRYDAGLRIEDGRVLPAGGLEETDAPVEEGVRRRIPWGLREVFSGIVAALVLYMFLGLVVVAPLVAIYGQDSLGGRTSLLVLSLALEAGLFTATWWLTVRRFHVSWRTLGYRALRSRWLWVPVATAISSFVIVSVVLALYTLFGYDAQQDTSQLTEKRQLLPLAGIMVMIAAPLAEETFFRGLVFGGLLKRFGLWPAALISGFLFGSAHVTGVSSAGLVLPFTFIGALFAYVYYRTGSLWASIGAHFVFNAVSFSLLAASS